MMKEKIYKNLNDICEKKIENSVDWEKQKFEGIKKILSHKNCFEKIDFQVAINILLDLGFEKNEAIDIFKKLVE